MSKLNRRLSIATGVIGKMIEWLLIVGIPLEVVEQICIAGSHRPQKVVPVLTLLVLVVLAAGVSEWKKREDD